MDHYALRGVSTRMRTRFVVRTILSTGILQQGHRYRDPARCQMTIVCTGTRSHLFSDIQGKAYGNLMGQKSMIFTTTIIVLCSHRLCAFSDRLFTPFSLLQSSLEEKLLLRGTSTRIVLLGLNAILTYKYQSGYKKHTNMLWRTPPLSYESLW